MLHIIQLFQPHAMYLKSLRDSARNKCIYYYYILTVAYLKDTPKAEGWAVAVSFSGLSSRVARTTTVAPPTPGTPVPVQRRVSCGRCDIHIRMSWRSGFLRVHGLIGGVIWRYSWSCGIHFRLSWRCGFLRGHCWMCGVFWGYFWSGGIHLRLCWRCGVVLQRDRRMCGVFWGHSWSCRFHGGSSCACGNRRRD